MNIKLKEIGNMKYLSQSACSTASSFLFISIWLSAVFLSFGDDYQYDREQYNGDNHDDDDDDDDDDGHLFTLFEALCLSHPSIPWSQSDPNCRVSSATIRIMIIV